MPPIEIVPVTDESVLRSCWETIRAAFGTVAARRGWTVDTAGGYTAFIPWEELAALSERGHRFFAAVRDGHVVGCAALAPSRRAGTILLEKLAVLPHQRHGGLGRRIVEELSAIAWHEGATTLGIAIVADEHVLKAWYEAQGFVATAVRTYDHLPFAVCFMSKPLAAPGEAGTGAPARA